MKMGTSKIYKIALEIGLKKDIKKKEDLDFDQPCPYPDRLILFAKKQREINRIAVGIDVRNFDIFFSKTVLKCDLVISHHPFSKAANNMPDLVLQQINNLFYYGIPKNQIKKPIETAVERLRREIMNENFYQEEQMGRCLDIDLMTLHTVTDNMAIFVLRQLIKDKRCATMGDFVEAVSRLYEFQLASQYGQTPFIANGHKNDALGKVSFSEFSGGQESSEAIFAEVKKAGIDTIIVPHLSENFFIAASKAGLKVIYCGHLASDSLGMNYFLDELKKAKKNLKIIPLGGLLRNENK